MEEVGALIKRLCKEKGMSQRQLATLSGVDRGYINQLVAGKEGIKKECGKGLIKIKKPIFSNDRNFTCTQFGQEFDFILAHSIFTHAPQSQIRRCISEVKKCMKPTGIFMATFLKGDNDYLGSEWSYPECIEYTLETMERIIEEFDLRCSPVKWHHRNQTLILITFPKAKIKIPKAIPWHTS